MKNDTKRPTAPDLSAVVPLPDATRGCFGVRVENPDPIPHLLQAGAVDLGGPRAFAAPSDDIALTTSGLARPECEMTAVMVSSTNKWFYRPTAQGAAVQGATMRKLSGNPIPGDMPVMTNRAAPATGMRPNDAPHSAN